MKMHYLHKKTHANGVRKKKKKEKKKKKNIYIYIYIVSFKIVCIKISLFFLPGGQLYMFDVKCT